MEVQTLFCSFLLMLGTLLFAGEVIFRRSHPQHKDNVNFLVASQLILVAFWMYPLKQTDGATILSLQSLAGYLEIPVGIFAVIKSGEDFFSLWRRSGS